MKPNFLFLFPDQHRGDWMPWGDKVFAELQTERPRIRMPNVEKLMKRGTSFYRCVTPSPLCAPARACLASGRFYEDCRVPDNEVDYPTDLESFYGKLRENGYSVGGVGKFDLHKVALYWGLEGWVDDLGKIGFTTGIDSEGKWDAIKSYLMESKPRGPFMKYLSDMNLVNDHLADMKTRQGPGGKYNTAATTLPDESYGDTWVGSNGVNMLRNFAKDKPWFLQVNFPGPHEPWDITASMKKRWEDTRFPAAERNTKSDPELINNIRQNYAAMLENIDTQIGRLMDEVEKRGETENTYFIYSSDHGEMLGDIDMFGKVKPDRGSVNVPLVLAGKGIRQNVTSPALADITDLSATILDYAGVPGFNGKFHDAVSMKPVLTGEVSEVRQSVRSALYDWKITIDKQYKTLYRGGAVVAKYDVQNDPWERKNLL